MKTLVKIMRAFIKRDIKNRIPMLVSAKTKIFWRVKLSDPKTQGVRQGFLALISGNLATDFLHALKNTYCAQHVKKLEFRHGRVLWHI